MGSTTIEWTDRTWNPVTGCTKVSAGCKNCYAEGVANRFFARQYGTIGTASGINRTRQFTDVWVHEDRLGQPLRWRKPARIFVNSMSDLFHEDVPFEFIDSVFAVMALCPQHTFQILTKRPERMREYLQQEDVAHYVDALAWEIVEEKVDPLNRRSDDMRATAQSLDDGPLKNVWLGVSVEDQKTADQRIPILLQTSAAVRFISYEPALGPLNLEYPVTLYPNGPPMCCSGIECGCQGRPIDPPLSYGLDWVIVGGESGPGARPFNIQWARDIVAQCKAVGVACFVKQLGANPRTNAIAGYDDAMQRFELKNKKGGDWNEWPEDLRVREFAL